MARDPFQSFIDLIQFDQKIVAAKQERDELLATIDKIDQEISQMNNRINAALEINRSLKKIVDDKEHQMQVYDDQESTLKKKLETVAGTKEYNALTAELNQVKKQQHSLEDEILAAWQQLESSKRSYDQELKSLAESISNNEVAKTTKQEMADRLEQGIKRLEDERTQHVIGIPDEWLEKYSLMREKITDPVVPVEYGSCSACFHNIPEPTMMLLRKRALLQCKGCFRFLYLPEVRNEQVES